MIVDAILVAAGRGDRFGGETPKQLQVIGGQAMWRWSYGAMANHPRIRRCVVVGPPDRADAFPGIAAQNLVAGGPSRSASVRAGLDRLAVCGAPPDAVLIHDAARPGLSTAVIDRVIDALRDAPAAAPALAVVDALKRTGPDGLQSVDRDALYRVQTPQGFHFALITRALSDPALDLVDDLAAVEALGATVALVEGDAANDKITYAEDMARMERLMAEHRSKPAPRASADSPPEGTVFRVGKGFDVHGFEPGDHVTLCGVAIPHDARLKGHSDADVAWHALTDAILGALALGDIGDHFPPSDPQWKGAPSNIFLKAAADMAVQRHYAIGNVDITVICEAPKVKPHREAMRTRTAELLSLALDQVSVKATTTEGLGFTGRREGIAAEAIVSLIPMAGNRR